MSYEAKRQNTARTIRKKGKLVTFTRNVKGEYNAGTQSYDANLDISQDVYVLSLPTTSAKRGDLDSAYKTDSAVSEKMSYVMMPSIKADGSDIDFEVKTGDKCEIENQSWTVLGSTPFRPNEGLAIYYDVALEI